MRAEQGIDTANSAKPLQRKDILELVQGDNPFPVLKLLEDRKGRMEHRLVVTGIQRHSLKPIHGPNKVVVARLQR